MHNLYGVEQKATSKKCFYIKIENTTNKKYTCLICDTAAAQIKHLAGEKQEITKSKHEDHIIMAEQERQLMKE